MTNTAITTPDFVVETDRQRKVTYYTPMTPRAYDWSHGTPEGSAQSRKGNLDGVVRFGRSFVFASDAPRASKLRGFLKGEDFTVQVVTR